MQPPINIALAYDETGAVIVHRHDCPVVRRQAERGEMVVTLMGGESMPDDLPLHDCLKPEEGRD